MLTVPFAFAKVQLAGFKSSWIVWIQQRGLAGGECQAWKLSQKLLAAFGHQPRQFGIMIREEQEGGGGTKLLPLKEHGGAGSQKKQGAQRLVAPWAGLQVR